MSNPESSTSLNFLEQIIEDELKAGKKEIYTRFPPEPNGYLHIGHVKAITTNFTIAQKYGGKTNLRFDDTNPVKEDQEYVDSIQEDIQWLGFEWEGDVKYASDYFDRLYDWAVQLVKEGKAYVDDSSLEEMRALRGTATKPGSPSAYRDRSAEENLSLLEGMKNGEYPEGSRVLRAKLDLASPNMQLRDPIMYRILHADHHRTGDKWRIYPIYDWAHGQSDAIEGITHSLCSLEFEVHRPLYDWYLDQVEAEFDPRPRQIEFSRLNLSYTVMSKRKLLQLVKENYVAGWDDPRMPTVSGMRRRGYTPEGIRAFIDRTGVTKRDNVMDLSLLEFSVREQLNKVAPRYMGILHPMKVIITNFPEGETEEMELDNNPEDPEAGSRKVPFTRELWLERGDFLENPPSPKKWYRLGPDRMVRLKGAFIIHCHDYVKDEATGEITELHCTYVPESRSGNDTSGLKVKGTLDWLSADHALTAEVRQYDRLFSDPDPDGHKDKEFLEFLNPDSLTVIKNAFVEPALKGAEPQFRCQFLRKGYYCVDYDSTEENLVFNQTVTLRDNWAKKGK